MRARPLRNAFRSDGFTWTNPLPFTYESTGKEQLVVNCPNDDIGVKAKPALLCIDPVPFDKAKKTVAESTPTTTAQQLGANK